MDVRVFCVAKVSLYLGILLTTFFSYYVALDIWTITFRLRSSHASMSCIIRYNTSICRSLLYACFTRVYLQAASLNFTVSHGKSRLIRSINERLWCKNEAYLFRICRSVSVLGAAGTRVWWPQVSYWSTWDRAHASRVHNLWKNPHNLGPNQQRDILLIITFIRLFGYRNLSAC